MFFSYMSSKWSSPSRAEGLFEVKLKVFSENSWRSTPNITVGLLLYELKMAFSELKIFSEKS